MSLNESIMNEMKVAHKSIQIKTNVNIVCSIFQSRGRDVKLWDTRKFSTCVGSDNRDTNNG